jgi:hypothetical protein
MYIFFSCSCFVEWIDLMDATDAGGAGECAADGIDRLADERPMISIGWRMIWPLADLAGG